MLPRRYRNTILKLLVLVPLLWLVVTLFIQSDSKQSHNSNNDNSHKKKPQSQARVDLLHNSNRLGEYPSF